MRSILRVLFLTLIIGLFVMRSPLSYADWQQVHNNGQGNNSGQNHSGGQAHGGGQNNGGGHGHDGGHDHNKGHEHPYIGVGFSVWPDTYYYDAPYYPPSDDVLISSFVYQPVIINGTTYYLNDGVYYIYNGYSYQPVSPPVTIIQPPGPSLAGPTVLAPIVTTDSFTINIPNDKGGYTAVTLKKSGNGYVGPQGEFYPNFPTVYQLKIIYGKKS